MKPKLKIFADNFFQFTWLYILIGGQDKSFYFRVFGKGLYFRCSENNGQMQMISFSQRFRYTSFIQWYPKNVEYFYTIEYLK